MKEPLITAANIMTPEVVTIGINEPLEAFQDIFVRRGIHHLLVEDQGKLVGIVSSEDVSKSKSWVVHDKITTGDIMTSLIKVVHPETSLKEVMDVFLEHNYRALPVVKGQTEIKGIITPIDIVKYYRFKL